MTFSQAIIEVKSGSVRRHHQPASSSLCVEGDPAQHRIQTDGPSPTSAQAAHKSLNRWQKMLECRSTALLNHITLRRAGEGADNVSQSIFCGYHRINEAEQCIKKRGLFNFKLLEAGIP